MAYIILAGKRDTDPEEDQNKKLLSDSDYNRVAYWGAKTYFPDGVKQDDGSVRAPTGDEVFHAITEAVFIDIKGKAESLLMREAAQAAKESVPEISLTPAK